MRLHLSTSMHTPRSMGVLHEENLSTLNLNFMRKAHFIFRIFGNAVNKGVGLYHNTRLSGDSTNMTRTKLVW